MGISSCLLPSLDHVGQENTVFVCELDKEMVGGGWLACERCTPKGVSCLLSLEAG